MTTPTPLPEQKPLHRGDAIGIALLTLVFLALSYIRGRHCAFWGDEIMGLLTLRQPTWPALLHVWRAGLDSSGIWFYVLGRPWIALFGPSELSLRAFSAVAIAASAVVIWIAARRYYPALPVAAAVCFVYASMTDLRWQLVNGRTYGIFMLAAALIIYLMLRGEDDSQTRPSPLFLLATFGAYSFMAGSHILGGLYVAAFLATQIALDLVRRRFRPLLYLSAACSFAVVAFSLANLKSTAALGKPSYWTLRPPLPDLLTFFSVFSGKRVGLTIIFLVLVLLLQARFIRSHRPVYIILLGFGGLNLFFFAYSKVATSIYVDRYLLPFAFAGILLLCELLGQMRALDAPFAWLRTNAAAILLLWGAFTFAHTKLPEGTPAPDTTARLLAALPPGLPVIDTDAAGFIEMEFYHPAGTRPRFLFPVDWQTALDPSIKGGVSAFHEMDNFKAVGWYAADILPYQQALALSPDFVVLTSPGDVPLWLQRRILADPRFQATLYQAHNPPEGPDQDIWLVHTR